MKHLLNGVAIAAVFAFARPVLGQPMTPTTPPKPAPAAPAKPTPPKPAPAPKAAGTKPMKHHHMMSKDDRMTEQLNAQELARIMGGSAPPPGGMAPPPGGMAPPPGGAAPPPGGMAPPPPQK